MTMLPAAPLLPPSLQKKVRTSASYDAAGLFAPLYHFKFMISLRVIQNDYGFLLVPKLRLPSGH